MPKTILYWFFWFIGEENFNAAHYYIKTIFPLSLKQIWTSSRMLYAKYQCISVSG